MSSEQTNLALSGYGTAVIAEKVYRANGVTEATVSLAADFSVMTAYNSSMPSFPVFEKDFLHKQFIYSCRKDTGKMLTTVQCQTFLMPANSLYPCHLKADLKTKPPFLFTQSFPAKPYLQLAMPNHKCIVDLDVKTVV